jgi:assimilatory nitrate reductase electron transfer subunit
VTGRLRVVVAGHGMVGARLVEELAATAGDRVDVTVLAAEEYEPYNRVLLSEVVAGRVDVVAITLPGGLPPGVTVRRGVAATAVDRARRVVRAADGAEHPYDVLVLATGARARIPLGLDPEALPAGVHPLRSLDHAREIVAASVNARRAAVLGGGVLGLEVACALAGRGVAVTVLHGGPHVMDRQLDDDAGRAAHVGLRRAGVDVRTGAAATALEVRDGRTVGIRVPGRDGGHGDEEVVPADLVVLTAGTEPETGLARDAGLTVRRGVVVDATCATADPAVFAVGDCAEPPEGGTGLVAQGWEQARTLARLLAERAQAHAAPHPLPDLDPHPRGVPSAAPQEDHPPRPTGRDVVRLKAAGLDVVAMGVCGARRPEGAAALRSVRLSDPAGGRHVEVVVSGDVLVGATCVGDARVGADLTAAYTRGTPLPADPAQLLLRPLAGAASAVDASPTLMPDRATVCRCNGVTKGRIVRCWEEGARSVEDVAAATRATTGCGGCTDAVCGLVDWLRRSTGADGQVAPGGEPAPTSADAAAGTPAAAPAPAAVLAGAPTRRA